MSAEELKAIRALSYLPQKAFAEKMGVPLRTYEDLEAGKSQVRPIHLRAAKYALIELLAEDEFGLMDISSNIAELLRAACANLHPPNIKP